MRYEKISAAKPASPHVETNMSEEALLQHQAESAMGAVRELLTKIQGDMAHVSDPREWAERYPWATVAVAAAAGFAAASVIKPKKAAPVAPASAAAPAAYAAQPASAPTAEERARYEAYLRDVARGEAAAPPPPPRESMWTPFIEMAKSAATRYIMTAAQTGIAAFAAAHAAKSAAEDAVDGAGDNHDGDASSDSNPDVRPT